MEQKKAQSSGRSWPVAQRAVCGQIRDWRGITGEEGKGSRHMQMMKACSAPEERGRGTEVLSRRGGGNEGHSHCTATARCSSEPCERHSSSSKDGNWLKSLWGAASPAGNADLLTLSILQELCVLKKPKYAKTKRKNKPSFQHYQHPAFLNFILKGQVLLQHTGLCPF